MVVAVGAIAVGTAAIGMLVAAADASVPAIPAVVTAAGGTAAVSLAVYISKKLLSGEITPLPITSLIDKMERIIERQDQQVERDRTERAELQRLVREATEANFAVHQYLRDNPAMVPRPPSAVDVRS